MYQRIIIAGRLGKDPEARYTQTGEAVTTFSVAVDNSKDKTIWFKVTAWDKVAESCAEYLTKGRLVLVEGRVGASAWKDKDGEARASLEVVAATVKFLDKSSDKADQNFEF